VVTAVSNSPKIADYHTFYRIPFSQKSKIFASSPERGAFGRCRASALNYNLLLLGSGIVLGAVDLCSDRCYNQEVNISIESG
jgi:hypothetical protein